MLPNPYFTNVVYYYILNYLSIAAAVLFNLSQLGKKKHILSSGSKYAIRYFSEKKGLKLLSVPLLWALIETAIITVLQTLPIPIVPEYLNAVLRTGNNYFGLVAVIPLVYLVYCFLTGTDFLKQLDLFTPAFPLQLMLMKVGCFCGGCCYGAPSSFGLYNYANSRVEYPVQLVETAWALMIFIFLLVYRKKAKEGTLFPLYIITYSGTRFFSEFFRGEENVFWIFKVYHIFCIVGVIVGVIYLQIVLKYGDKIRKINAKYHGFMMLDIKEKKRIEEEARREKEENAEKEEERVNPEKEEREEEKRKAEEKRQKSQKSQKGKKAPSKKKKKK